MSSPAGGLPDNRYESLCEWNRRWKTERSHEGTFDINHSTGIAINNFRGVDGQYVLDRQTWRLVSLPRLRSSADLVENRIDLVGCTVVTDPDFMAGPADAAALGRTDARGDILDGQPGWCIRYLS